VISYHFDNASILIGFRYCVLGVESCGSMCESHSARTARNLTVVVSLFTVMNSRIGFRTCMTFCFLVPTVVLMKRFVSKVDFVRTNTCDPYYQVAWTREVGRM